MAELLYNEHSQSVCLDEVSISRASINHPSTGVVLGHKETWTVAATLIGDTASLLTQVSELEAAYAEGGHDIFLKTEPDGTVLHQILNAQTADGVRVSQRPSFPTLKNAEFVNKRAYTLAVEADMYDGDPELLVDDERWSYQIGQDGKTTRTFSGRLETAAGQSAEGYFAAKDPGTPAGYTRGPKGREINHDDTEMSYSYSDREHWQALPAGVLDGAYTQSVQASGDTRTLTIAGRFVGPTASVDAAIRALRQTGRKELTDNIVTEPFSGAKSFTLTYEYNDRTVRNWQESVTIIPSRIRQIYHEVLGGGSAVRQEGAKTTARASVSGRATGRNGYPQFPTPLWPAVYLTPGGESLGHSAPKRGSDGKHMDYGISWRRDYEFALNINVRLPRVR